jgi:hypothetical protein
MLLRRQNRIVPCRPPASMRVTLHLGAQNPMLLSMNPRSCPPKPARDIAATVTGSLPTGSGRFPPTCAAPCSRWRVTAAASPPPGPAPLPVACRSQAGGSATSARRCPLAAASSALDTAPGATSPPLGTSPAPWPGALVLGDSAEASGTPRSTFAASLPRADRERTNFRIRYSVDCGPSCRGASLDGHADGRPRLPLGPVLHRRGHHAADIDHALDLQTAAGWIR